MATDDDDDEFFGSQQDDDGLPQREAHAVAEQHRTLGFHATFTISQEAAMQEGFNSGYSDTFEKATAIGLALGQQAALAKLVLPNAALARATTASSEPKGDTKDDEVTDATRNYLLMAQTTRFSLTSQQQENDKEDGSELAALEELDRKLQAFVTTSPGAPASPPSSSS